MLDSTKEFLEKLVEQAHNDYVPKELIAKAIEQKKIEESWDKELETRKAEEIAREEMYKRGIIPEDEKAAAEKALKDFILPQIQEQIEENIAREAVIADRLSNLERSQEGREQIERLVEITRKRKDYIDEMIKDAEAQGNELLLKKYTQEKAEVEKDLDIYISKYEKFKAEAEG